MLNLLLTFSLIVSPPDSLPKTADQPLHNPRLLQGNWAAVGEDNVCFIFKGKKVIYPDSFKSYPYFLSGDTLTIQYDDYQGISLVRIHLPDTLILISDERQVFYRFKGK